MPGTLRVDNLHELQAAFAKFEPETRRVFRAGLRQVAEPVQRGAEQLAEQNISRIGPRWSKMRIGITRDLVYVAPRQRGTRGRGPAGRRRGQGFANPPFSDILMGRAMEPALEQHAADVEARMGLLVDGLVQQFNQGAF
jgi:hypothetical protein